MSAKTIFYIEVAGIDNWPEMPDDFFRYGTRKRVSRDKKKCTLAITKATKIEQNKNGENVSLDELVSCRIAIEFVAKKYFINNVEGWTLSAKIIMPI
jgi:hypothetical protein